MDRTNSGLFVEAEGGRKPLYKTEMISTRLVYMMFSLALLALVIVSAAVVSGRPLTGQPKDAPVAFQRTLTLTGNGNAVLATNEVGETILDTPQGGFISVVIDGLERARTVHKVEGNPPVILTQYENGRLNLTDPATGWTTELASFGPGNLGVWHDLVTR
ncbi:photosynthetic complex assembly protein PuhC [Palleronia sp. KMU-117]|uniref:photosynthetic complex assembly protein PuhC n=1 Tax=Palleronia sp. KMU-117 TaxID=3434108 RepID=UPI003D756035